MRYIQILSYIPINHPDIALGIEVSAAARGARQRGTGLSELSPGVWSCCK